jgi:para-aminobenzoate synthetase/4-amino-4-deoxychorismate lyase
MLPTGTILIHDSRQAAGHSLLFEAPRAVFSARRKNAIARTLAEAETALAGGCWLAGYLSYDLGLAFEERLEPLLANGSQRPLLWLGAYDPPLRLDRWEAGRWLAAAAAPGGVTAMTGPDFGMSREAYGRAHAKVMDYIAAGDVYQVNLTFQARFHLSGDPVGLYCDLIRKQPVEYGALMRADDHWVLSLSPELFIAVEDGLLRARPMKGTAPRGRTPAEDDQIRAHLCTDEKSRAENLMIVDLLRNDLSRVAAVGSVRVSDLFSLETHQSLHQMTSGITARRRADVGFASIARALFPCGSVTGAPKIRAMEIIDEIEAGPRGLYTGSLGFAAPSGDMRFNVMIRTAVIDDDGRVSLGIGGGIVADSRAVGEYEECLLKLRFFAEPWVPIKLIETMAWQKDTGFRLLDRHLHRLAQSAAYFAIPCDLAAVRAALEDSVRATVSPLRVRLLLDEEGIPTVTTSPLKGSGRPWRFVVSDATTNSGDRFLYHKTTRRTLYDRALDAAKRAHGVDEVIFRNERGELTEGSITNLFVERKGRLLTPPVSSGLLSGTFRAHLIDCEGARVQERVLTLADLEDADRVFLGNSVRGLIAADWVSTARGRARRTR